MITQIVVHLLPHEIDWFEWQSKQFKIGSYYLNSEDTVIIDVTLNINLVDWSQSQLPKQFFIDKFNQIKTLWDWAETQFIVDDENKCLGCDDKRRESIRSTTADNILYLDSDVIFKPELLSYILEASEVINHEYYIISPQTVRMWDSSWDILTNKKYLNVPANMDTYYSNDPFKIISTTYEDINVTPIYEFKFGGGWFNLLSTKLLKLTDIPDSFGPYGIDDLYVMICCNLMKQKGYDVQQYVLENSVVIENFKYRWDSYKNYLYLINKQNEFRKQAEDNLNLEIEKFINKI
jgi:hypothetical protein